ncbi:efflux RND transporter periplasmic adaptor subunit [Candidatus Methylocalor cossyra]|uniref:RND family efflux transporter MFP subunit n=1 Tax=Candidatus Methylocalor cossyra TaxID=3108543 RepID=A0ABM9NKF2_9GAMM
MSESTLTRAKLLSAALAVGGLVLLLLWLQGAFEAKVAPGVSPAAAQEPIGNRPVAPVVKRELDAVFAWPGTVSAQITAQIAPKVTGRILDITVRAGDRVRRGQVLARLDQSELQARLGQARSALAAAEAEAGRAAAEARRVQNLFDRDAATRRDLDAALASARGTEAQVGAAREAVRATESQLGETVLVAPFDGTVVRRHQEPGDMALPGSPVLTLQQSQRLRIESAVPAHCAGFLRLEQVLKVRLAHPPGQFPAVVDEIQPAADPKTRTVLVKARLPEAAGISPGAFGWLYQSCGKTTTLLVPAAAVSRVGQLESVRLVVGDGTRLRQVRTGKTYDGQREILSGLREGDRVLLPEPRP